MSCAGVNCNSRFTPAAKRKACCGGKSGKPTPQPKTSSKDDPGPFNLNKPLNKICRQGENLGSCVLRTSPLAGGTDDVKDKTNEEKGQGAGTTNPDSGCPNCNTGDVLCGLYKMFICEPGHIAHKTTEESLPMIAIAVGAVIVLLLVLK